MKLLHCADLHLGFRAYSRVMMGDAAGKVTAGEGCNVREADVMRTFSVLVDRAIQLRPDVIVIAGDVFHASRPSNWTLDAAFAEFWRLMAALPKAIVVITLGNHDLPRSRETAHILGPLRLMGIHVVDWEAQRLTFAELGLSILAVPDAPGMVRPELVPDSSAKHNLLVLHGEVQGMMARRGVGEHASKIFTAAEMRATEWSYLALGHYHVYREIAPNCFYSGSIDLTSSNPWGEIEEARDAGIPGKGFIVHDLETGEHTFHSLPESRRYIDLPTFSAHELSAEDINEALARAIAECPGGIDDQIIRAVITDCPKEVARELDAKAIGSYKRRALNFNLTVRRPENVRILTAAPGGRRKPLEQILADFLERRFANDPELGAQVAALSRRYMDKATEKMEGTVGLAATTAIEPQEAVA